MHLASRFKKIRLPLFLLALFLPLACLIFVTASSAQTPQLATTQPAAAVNLTDAQKAALARRDELIRRKMEMAGMVLSAWHDAPLDIYMAGSDLKEPTLKNVMIMSAIELPNGSIFYNVRDSERREILINPANIVMTRTIAPIWKN